MIVVFVLVIFNILMIFILYLELLISISIFNLVFKYIKHYFDYEYCCKYHTMYTISTGNMEKYMIKYCSITHSTNVKNIIYFSNYILASVYCKKHMNYLHFTEHIFLYSLFNLILPIRIYIHVSGYYIRLMFFSYTAIFILKKTHYTTYFTIFIVLYYNV